MHLLSHFQKEPISLGWWVQALHQPCLENHPYGNDQTCSLISDHQHLGSFPIWLWAAFHGFRPNGHTDIRKAQSYYTESAYAWKAFKLKCSVPQEKTPDGNNKGSWRYVFRLNHLCSLMLKGFPIRVLLVHYRRLGQQLANQPETSLIRGGANCYVQLQRLQSIIWTFHAILVIDKIFFLHWLKPWVIINVH